MKYARLDSQGTVVEVFETPAGFSIQDCVHPSLVELFMEAPNDVKVHDTYRDEVWTSYVPPPPEPEPEPTPEPTSIPTTEV